MGALPHYCEFYLQDLDQVLISDKNPLVLLAGGGEKEPLKKVHLNAALFKQELPSGDTS